MVRMSNPTYIKVTVTPKEADQIDDAIKNGYGKNRADLCRVAMFAYLASIKEAV